MNNKVDVIPLPHKELKSRALERPDVKKEYDRLERESSPISMSLSRPGLKPVERGWRWPMTKGRSLQGHISEKMKEPEFKKAWNDLDAEFNVLEIVMKTGKKHGRGLRALLSCVRFTR